MIVLRPTNLHWIDGLADNAQDLCAHSPVEFRIDQQVLVHPNDGDWTVSASALYLLRTLAQSHTRASPVGEHLFPCCGFNMYDIEGETDIAIVGCPNGLDFEVLHDAHDIVIREPDATEHRVSFPEWRNAVCAFADSVRLFYDASSPKRPHDSDVKVFSKFWAEWSRRRSMAEDMNER